MTDTKHTPAVGDINVIGALKRCGSESFQSKYNEMKKKAVEKNHYSTKHQMKAHFYEWQRKIGNEKWEKFRKQKPEKSTQKAPYKLE